MAALEDLTPGIIVTSWRERGYFKVVEIWQDPRNDHREGIDKLILLDKIASTSGKIIKKGYGRTYQAATLYLLPRTSLVNLATRELDKWSLFLDTMSTQKYSE